MFCAASPFLQLGIKFVLCKIGLGWSRDMVVLVSGLNPASPPTLTQSTLIRSSLTNTFSNDNTTRSDS